MLRLVDPFSAKGNSKVSDAESALESLVERQRSQREQQHCAESPSHCNLCAKPLVAERFLVDGEAKGTPQIPAPDGTSVGQWAYMCASCFSSCGVGIGWGSGQLYERTSRGFWLLVAGFAPRPDDA